MQSNSTIRYIWIPVITSPWSYQNSGSPYEYGELILMSKEIVSQFCFESVFSFDHRRTFAVQLWQKSQSYCHLLHDCPFFWCRWWHFWWRWNVQSMHLTRPAVGLGRLSSSCLMSADDWKRSFVYLTFFLYMYMTGGLKGNWIHEFDPWLCRMEVVMVLITSSGCCFSKSWCTLSTPCTSMSWIGWVSQVVGGSHLVYWSFFTSLKSSWIVWCWFLATCPDLWCFLDVWRQVLYSAWVELSEGMVAARSLDEVIACHDAYLMSIQRQCLIAHDKLVRTWILAWILDFCCRSISPKGS